MAYQITVDGIVQGVGFRPFVYTLAVSMKMKGHVKNSTYGVIIHLECSSQEMEEFIKRLKDEAPKNSRILDITVEKTEDLNLKDFTIEKSTPEKGITLIPSDLSICKDCISELFDPLNRRYLYPFINCTNCGPRYSIIKNIPYDRDKTTMADFTMCPDCKKEYLNETDRRFHAQPNCCEICGPFVYLSDLNLKGVEAIKRCASLIDSGEVVAIKGLGGYHLICDARNEEAINRLRRLKKRKAKPFAVMVKDAETIKNYLNDDLISFFDSPAAPIVITEIDDILPDLISPLNKKIGFMKAYTPLHQLLFYFLKTKFIIATSANEKDEPIVIDEKDAENKLGKFTRYFLHHNRPIHTRVDDSVFTVFEGKPYPIRVSRGLAPIPIVTGLYYKESYYGAGAGLKSHIAFTKGKYTIVSQYIGDLDNVESAEFYEETFEKLINLFEIDVKKIITDLHPDYYSTIFAERYAGKKGIKVIKLQHHKAHLFSIMSEHRKADNIIGVIFDGTGLGEDGAIWGGEIFYKKGEVNRRFHLKYFRQPGGDAAARSPYRMLIGYLLQIGMDENIIEKLETAFDSKGETPLIKSIIYNSINSPLTSSMGRLFEAIGSILTGVKANEFEGHAAIALESIAKFWHIDKYPYKIEDNVIDISKVIESVILDYFKKISPEDISFKFHKTVAHIILDCCKIIREETGIDTVLFSGGVFQNILLLKLAEDLLKENSFTPLHHHILPPNDASIALGQVYYAGIYQ
ncbi:MAG: carbamoyltransferase HypF [Calditerrivibrio nitroreducens]|uniref:Carbamoyltransferase n=1 Tax=Calditerrivibrio nitroreducens TaxID=477976 RepID=A0A2J6WN83_9BACT|nr:MAG: carbamoyltransferase HypF [Calditerrivibrio nitroreducens]